MEQKRYPEAVAALRSAAEGLDRALGSSHRYSVSAWNNYAIASCSGPDPASGLAAEQRIAEMRAKTLTPGDWHLANTQAIIGLCLVGLRRYVEAESILLKATGELETSRGPKSPNTQRAYQWLRKLYQVTGRDVKAEALALKAQPE
jgi:hypothetical protein